MKKKFQDCLKSPLLAAIVSFLAGGLTLFFALRAMPDANKLSFVAALLFLAGGAKHLYRYLYG